MIIERIDLDKIKYQNGIVALSSLEVGESIFCSEFAKAQSLTVADIKNAAGTVVTPNASSDMNAGNWVRWKLVGGK